MDEAVRGTASTRSSKSRTSRISFFTRARRDPGGDGLLLHRDAGRGDGLVGESGCGKSTVALGIMRDLGNVGKIVGGRSSSRAATWASCRTEELRDIRGYEIAMIYQEPMASLNPAMKVGQQLMEVPIIHDKVSQGRGLQACARMVRAVRLPDPGAHDAVLSAPALRRPAAAHRHRHGADVEAGAAAARRADHRARRHRRGRHRRSGQGPRQAVRHLDALHLAQSRPDPRDLRPHHRDVFGRGGRDRPGQGRVRPHAPPLYAGAVPLDPAARRRQEHAAADRHSRPIAAAARAAEGLQLRAALPPFRRRAVRRPRDPDAAGDGHDATTAAACASTRSTGRRCRPNARKNQRAGQARRAGAADRRPKKYYQVAANEIFGGGEGRVVKANETISFEAREAETLAIVGESGCGKSTLAKVLLGLETATAGSITLGNNEIQSTADRDARRAHRRPRSRWCSRTRSTR